MDPRELYRFVEAYEALEMGLKVSWALDNDRRYLDYLIALEEIEDLANRLGDLVTQCISRGSCDSLYDMVEASDICVEEPEYNEPGYIDRDPDDWGWDNE